MRWIPLHVRTPPCLSTWQLYSTWKTKRYASYGRVRASHELRPSVSSPSILRSSLHLHFSPTCGVKPSLALTLTRQSDAKMLNKDTARLLANTSGGSHSCTKYTQRATWTRMIRKLRAPLQNLWALGGAAWPHNHVHAHTYIHTVRTMYQDLSGHGLCRYFGMTNSNIGWVVSMWHIRHWHDLVTVLPPLSPRPLHHLVPITLSLYAIPASLPQSWGLADPSLVSWAQTRTLSAGICYSAKRWDSLPHQL